MRVGTSGASGTSGEGTSHPSLIAPGAKERFWRASLPPAAGAPVRQAASTSTTHIDAVESVQRRRAALADMVMLRPRYSATG